MQWFSLGSVMDIVTFEFITLLGIDKFTLRCCKIGYHRLRLDCDIQSRQNKQTLNKKILAEISLS